MAETSDEPTTAMAKLVPIIVGALLGVIPVTINTALQARANRSQAILAQRLTVVHDLSEACARRVELARRALSLVDIAGRGPWAPEVQTRLMTQFEALDKDREDATVTLAAQVTLANAVFQTDLSMPTPTAPEELPRSEEEFRRLNDSAVPVMREAVPRMARQCAAAVSTLVARVRE